MKAAPLQPVPGLRPFSLLVKPAGPDCNLRCGYCFYLDRAGIYPDTAAHRMGNAVLERMVSGYMATPQPCYTFGWQGGEPTLMGAAFFRRVTELQQQYGAAGATVSNGLQTNGTLITDDLAGHLAAYRFLVGLSVDGPAVLHDRYRRDAGGRGSHAVVVRGMERLRAAGVEFNILTLVSQSNVSAPETVYRYLRDELGCLYHQYIECVEFDSAGRLQPFAIGAAEWGAFLCRLFDEWLRNDTRRVSVRLFDTLLSKLVDGIDNTCASGRDCRQYFVVEHNGDIYPCDFHVTPDLRLGNVMTDAWPDLQRSPAYEAFGRRKSQWHPRCSVCSHRLFCNGDCPKNRALAGRGEAPLSHLCDGWRRFYDHARPRLEELAQDVRRERAAATAQAGTPPGRAPGRNDACPCGSGRKYKRCCGV